MSVAGVALIAAPWLVSFTWGPAPAWLQWVLSVACAASFVTFFWALPLSERATLIFGGWAVAASVSATMGVFQYLGAEQMLGGWVDHARVGEAYANLRQRNQFATLVNIGLVALLFGYCGRRASALEGGSVQGLSLPKSVAATEIARRSVLWGLTALLAIGVAASTSRTGLMQLLSCLALALVWRDGAETGSRDVAWKLAAFCVVVYAASSVLLPYLAGADPRSIGIVSRLQPDSGPGCSSRLVLWSNVLHLITQKPWFGWGWGELAFAHFTTIYPGERFCEILGNAHNLPLHLAVELGIPVAVVLTGGAVWVVARARPWLERDPVRRTAWAVLALIALHSLLEYPLWYGPFQVAVVLSIGLLASRPLPHAPVGAFSTLPAPWLLCAGLLAIAVCGLVATQYWRMSQIYLMPEQRDATYREDTLEKAKGALLYRGYVRFAELGVTPLTADNAVGMRLLALEMLHFSPEPMVVQKLIDSARLLGDDATAAHYEKLYLIAYPDASPHVRTEPPESDDVQFQTAAR